MTRYVLCAVPVSRVPWYWRAGYNPWLGEPFTADVGQAWSTDDIGVAIREAERLVSEGSPVTVQPVESEP